tara:strand:- start:68 stop:1327 length:1260 start_codon:yes stop_codon:yes gene_type:complete
MDKNLKKRSIAEKKFRFFGLLSVLTALSLLAILFISIIHEGTTAFIETKIKINADFDEKIILNSGRKNIETIQKADFNKITKKSLSNMFPSVTGRSNTKDLYNLVSSSTPFQLKKMILKDPNLIGKKIDVWVIADDDIDMIVKGNSKRDIPEENRRVKNFKLSLLEKLEKDKRVDTFFNNTLFTKGDSRDPEQAGILGALLGSFFALIITLALAFPLGITTAIYLEKFAVKNNRFIEFIEVNINNLAAVPSIIFGLLGLAIFLNFFGMPRSIPVVGGLVLAVMTLPTIIIASRVAIKSVPPSIEEAALGLGASKTQAVLHHVVPNAMPGMLTGTIIGMARALGESAPLLMIGMVAFIVDIPQGFTDPATALPIQIYLWSDTPERGFVEKTAAGIIVLLVFLMIMNALAIYFRKKLEKKN